MIKKYLLNSALVLSLSIGLGVLNYSEVHAQVFGPQEIKWLWVSSLRQYFSSGGQEIEYGRRGRGPYLNTDQTDGLRWPAQYQSMDHNVGKALWIGTTNFTDPTNGITYPHKVINFGRAAMYTNLHVYPEEFRLIGKFDHPTVIVDDARASDLDENDLDLTGTEDKIDPNLPTDRMIYNRVNTPIGVTVYRKVLASTQQYHDNYYIYEYVFKNTGLIDNAGGKITPVKKLTDVVFDFRYRFTGNKIGYDQAWGWAQISWGINTLNEVVGQDATHTLPAPNNFRAIYSYYGPHSASTGVLDDIGGPNFQTGSILGGADFTGEVVLHADSSPHDTTNDINQPSTTRYFGSDGTIENINPTSPYSAAVMTQQYQSMTGGNSGKTHAEQVGKDANGWPNAFANTLGNAGGYSSQQGFGPYTLEPGDSVRIVIAEAVAGISHDFNLEVTRNWWNWYHNGNKSGSELLTLPSGAPWNGGKTTDGNLYKNAWVFSSRDSLFQTFRRAIRSYNSGYKIPQPPPPPDKFTVSSGGDRIMLQWSSARNAPHFNGYRVYRAETTTQNPFELIFSCDRANEVTAFDDTKAKRGFNYFYYIQTKDDGTTNDIEPGVPLVSSKFYTMTNVGASLRRPAANSLSEIRVVPNPYNIKAASIQFGTNRTVQNQLSFFGLPPQCKIKIYTDNGDLVQTIDHTNGSGDEKWNSLTSSGQIVVSGLYIAYFEVTQDAFDTAGGKLLFRKGDNIIRKFIIIR